ncbi:MAG: beta-galactosidase [Tannerellaceae bacterium]|jgi:beta-galactosidase|nr:beta-galactosidase [Tannerellaceae bacterium]
MLLLFQSCSKKETFEVGDKTFVLNGKPFVVKAAEMHYPRIPQEYWEHRIRMCKALGMNAICLYVFWNIHEPEEGQFDFTGNNDVAAFCRLAQKHGMYLILRPGPYVCAEWEMGGLPWWLLKKKDIALRTQAPYFMERVRLFMAEVGKQLGGLQLANGGNILMVQVENEYGAYGIDKPYVAEVRDIVKASGFDKTPLFQCDWSSNFENNALDDLLWTINFGIGANIDEQFKRLKELRPETPLMCSEYWSGWFDHWGARHETRSADELVAGMKQMLDKNISFSLYMTHGGTSFGHWAGANFPGYVPDCTSYDYDAPVSESGRATPKYFKVRELLQRYLPEALPDVPDSIPTIRIPAIAFNEIAPLFDNLPEPATCENIQSMEFFNQGWGSILYRTVLKKSDRRQLLKITEAYDWVQVFMNGERIGILNRLKGESSLPLPPVNEDATLDILVEAMGRRNFGAGVLDYKGITEKVEIISENDTTELKDWKVYSFPVNYAFAENRNYRKITGTVAEPAYYRAVFHLDKTGDTFLDMSNWTKGMVYVNGHNIGRFWEIGPQQTLYLPGCWLRKGGNEIIVLDMAGTGNPAVSGLRQPVLDVLRGNGAYKFRKQGETLDLSGETPIYSGRFKAGNGWQKIPFGKTYETRYFCLEALNSHGGDDFASIAELEILGIDGKPLSRRHWKIVYADSEEADAANNIASNVFDLQESTIWHTSCSINRDKFPHQIVIDLGETKAITGFEYLPRQESNKPGMVKDFRIYVGTTPFKY